MIPSHSRAPTHPQIHNPTHTQTRSRFRLKITSPQSENEYDSDYEYEFDYEKENENEQDRMNSTNFSTALFTSQSHRRHALTHLRWITSRRSCRAAVFFWDFS
jgi:hypothetical protein